MAHSLIRLTLASGSDATDGELSRIYFRAARALTRCGYSAHLNPLSVGWTKIVLRSLERDAKRLPSDDVCRIIDLIDSAEAPLDDECFVLMVLALAAGWPAEGDAYFDRLSRIVDATVGLDVALSPENCLELLTNLPVLEDLQLGYLLEMIEIALESPAASDRLQSDPDFAVRISAAWERFEHYR
jgi:hypothetical protein